MSATAHETSRDGDINGVTDSRLGEVSDKVLESTVRPSESGVDCQDFAAIYAARFDRMVGQLCRMGFDRDRALDLVQEAFLTCWERRNQLRAKLRLSGWIIASALHR